MFALCNMAAFFYPLAQGVNMLVRISKMALLFVYIKQGFIYNRVLHNTTLHKCTFYQLDVGDETICTQNKTVNTFLNCCQQVILLYKGDVLRIVRRCDFFILKFFTND